MCIRFPERLILVHSVRHSSELAWCEEIAALPALFPNAKATLRYIPVVTRERPHKLLGVVRKNDIVNLLIRGHRG